MKGKRSGGAGRQLYEERTEAIAAPIAEGFGIYVYDVEYVREGEEYYLNVYIDKEGGVTIGDCENVSRLLSDALDAEDFITDPYTLIVSSPGLGRALTKDRHLRQSIGQEVEIHLYRPDPETGEKDLAGELAGFDDEGIVILAEPPVPAKGKGKKKGSSKKAKNKKDPAEPEESAGLTEPAGQIPDAEPAGLTETAEAAGRLAEGEQAPAQQDGRQKRTVARKAIASIRLAFDF